MVAVATVTIACAVPAAALVSNWQLRVTDAGRPVQGATVTIGLPDNVVLDTQQTDANGRAFVQKLVTGISYEVTVKTPTGKVRKTNIVAGSGPQGSTIDVAGRQLNPYVSIFGGATFPNSFTGVKGIQDNDGIEYSDTALKTSGVVGLKAGLFLQKPTRWHTWREWLGAELEVSYTTPHVKQQAVTLNGTSQALPIAGPVTADFPGAHVRMLTVAMQLVVRYPGEYFQPYIAGGPAIFWARMSGPNFGGTYWGTASDTSLGVQAVAGLRAFLPDGLYQSVRWFGFFEGRYQRASFDFGGNSLNSNDFVFVHVDYAPYQAIGGIGIEF